MGKCVAKVVMISMVPQCNTMEYPPTTCLHLIFHLSSTLLRSIFIRLSTLPEGRTRQGKPGTVLTTKPSCNQSICALCCWGEPFCCPGLGVFNDLSQLHVGGCNPES